MSTAIRSAADIEEVGWPEPGRAAGADGVDAQLLAELAPFLVLTRHGVMAPQVVCRGERGPP